MVAIPIVMVAIPIEIVAINITTVLLTGGKYPLPHAYAGWGRTVM